MPNNLIDPNIVCCYLYIISRYGYPPPPEQTVKHLIEMHALGFQSIELEGIRADHLKEIYHYRHEIKAKIEELKLNVPYFCVVLPGLSSENRNMREENLRLFEIGCQIAQLFDSRGVLDNAPLPPYQFSKGIPVVRHYDEDVLLPASIPYDLDWKKYWQDLISTYQSACDIAANHNLTYHMHPCLGVLGATSDAFLYFHDAVKRDNLRFNLDTANQYVMKENLSLALIRGAEYIDYIHLSDNRGVKVEHLPPGKGKINWENFFSTLDYTGFKGHIGLDIGGEESQIEDLDKEYIASAMWLESNMKNRINF
jgi:sugar phosphate isomerase/epimerase